MNSNPMQARAPALVKNLGAFDPLRNALQSMAARHGARLKYQPNEGNAGDALIAAGTWQFFDDIGVAPEYTTVRGLAAGDAVIFGGGGNLVPEYSGCQTFLEQCLEVEVASVLVLPHSIRGHESLLYRLDDRFTLVCRDLDSLMRVQDTQTRAHVLYAPDMALYIDVDRLFSQCDAYRGARLWLSLASVDRLVPYFHWRWSLSRRDFPVDGHLTLMRCDAESPQAQIADAWWDLSDLYGSKFRLRAESDLVARDLLHFFDRARSVRTNRLHIGVAAAFMGCRVAFRDNSYGKVGAVYRAWLSHLPTVTYESAEAVA